MSAPVWAATAALSPMWSQWPCVETINLSVQPRSASSSAIQANDGMAVSIAIASWVRSSASRWTFVAIGPTTRLSTCIGPVCQTAPVPPGSSAGPVVRLRSEPMAAPRPPGGTQPSALSELLNRQRRRAQVLLRVWGTPEPRCPTCGAKNDPGAKFCGECGSALAPDAPSALSTSTGQPRATGHGAAGRQHPVRGPRWLHRPDRRPRRRGDPRPPGALLLGREGRDRTLRRHRREVHRRRGDGAVGCPDGV